MTTEEYARIVSRNLKRIAYTSGKSQAEIARDLKINKSTLSSWMSGHRIPKMDKIDMLCDYFQVSRSDIMEPDHIYVELPSITAAEMKLIEAYRASSPARKESVRVLLGMEGDE